MSGVTGTVQLRGGWQDRPVTDYEGTALAELTGAEVESVIFVRDYLQITLYLPTCGRIGRAPQDDDLAAAAAHLVPKVQNLVARYESTLAQVVRAAFSFETAPFAPKGTHFMLIAAAAAGAQIINFDQEIAIIGRDSEPWVANQVPSDWLT